MRQQVTVANQAAADQWLLNEVASLAKQAVRERGRFVMAISGGSSPLPFYRALALADFPWESTDVWLVDERFVPPGHPDHNGSAIRSILEGHDSQVPRLLPKSLHLIDTSSSDLESSRASYEADVAGLAGKDPWPVFDFMLLGMGADGHTASLFPGTGAARVNDKTVIAVTPLTAPHQRISLTLPVLNAARCVVFLVTGASKREMLAKVLAEASPDLPASLVQAERVVWLGDEMSQGTNL